MNKFSISFILKLIEFKGFGKIKPNIPSTTLWNWSKKNSKQLDFMLEVRDKYGISLDEQIPKQKLNANN